MIWSFCSLSTPSTLLSVSECFHLGDLAVLELKHESRAQILLHPTVNVALFIPCLTAKYVAMCVIANSPAISPL